MHHQTLPNYSRSFSLASLRTTFRRSASTSSTSSVRSHISAPIISPSTHHAKPPSYLSPQTSPAYPTPPPPHQRSPSAHYNPLAAHPLGLVIPTAPSSPQIRDHHRNSGASYSSPVDTIRSIMSQQLTFVDLEEERRNWGREIGVLEPRPVVFWGGMEEMLCL